MDWIIYSLLATCSWAFVNVIDKFTLSKLVKSPLLPVFALSLVGIVASLIIFLIQGLAVLPLHLALLALLAGVIYLLVMYFYYQAIKLEEVSKVIPLYYLSPIFTLLGSTLLLGEKPNFSQELAIVLLVIGAIGISFKPSFQMNINKAAIFILLAAISYSLNQIITKYLLSYADFWTIFSYGRIGLFLVVMPILCFKFRLLSSELKYFSLKATSLITFNQILNVSGVLLITIALTKGYVSLVNGLTSIQPALVFVIATSLSLFFPHLMKESTEKSELIQKALATLIIIIGSILIA